MTPPTILGITIDPLSSAEALSQIKEGIEAKRRQFIVTVNPEIITLAHQHAAYRDIVSSATMRLADGTGVTWAAEYLAKRADRPSYFHAIRLLVKQLLLPSRMRNIIPETIPGADLVIDLAGMSEEFGYKMYLLGAGPGVAEEASQALTRRFPRLQIAGASAGGKGVPREDATIRREIKNAKPAVVLVAYGAPKQEQWIHRNLSRLPAPVVAVGVGGTFDYLAGAAAIGTRRSAKQPPAFIRRRGLEWLWRLVTQPSRWRRIMTALPLFVIRIIRHG